MTLPTSLDAKHQQELSKLQQSSGEEFDKEFAKCSLKGHAKAVAKFQKATQQIDDAEVKQFAQEVLPDLQKHHKESLDIARAVGLDQATIASLNVVAPEAAGTPGASSQYDRGSSSSEADLQRGSDLQPDRDSSLQRQGLDEKDRKDLPRTP